MSRLNLVLPSPKYKEQLMDYKREFIENGDSMDGSAGHIEYSVRKSERKQGYATEMLALALKECKILGIREVLITCDKDNIASAKTIINNGGKLENEIFNVDKITQRYWIN
jgi:predicted acetyltransferase